MKRSRRRRRSSRAMLLAAIVLLIAGFLVRRTLGPRALAYLTHRPPDKPLARELSSDAPRPRAQASAAPAGENLTDQDRRELDQVLRRKLR